MPSVRPFVALRATLLLVLALVCGICVVPSPVGPVPQPARAQGAVPAAAAAYEAAHAGGSEADTPGSSVLHRDRRRAATAPAGPPGPPSLATHSAPLTDPPAGRKGGPDTRPRPVAAHSPSALQVFLC